MKNILIMLVLQFTTLMADDYIITRDLLALAGNNNTPISDDISPYLEPINLPECDANNTEVQFIKSNSDWSSINSSSKRIFCVSPGDYTSLKNILLTRSGTLEKKRYIILDNGNDLHPGKLDKKLLANFALDFQAASYWVIDRGATFDVGMSHSFIVSDGSSFNIFNRMLANEVFHFMWVQDGSHDNTIQNSRIDSMTTAGAAADLAAINIQGRGTNLLYSIKNTKVINNEFVNVKPFRLGRAYGEMYTWVGAQTANYEGFVADSNTIEYAESIRTDCNGNLDVNGECLAVESGCGIKAGSDNPDNPVIYSNNKYWGFRTTDPTYPNLSGAGSGIVAYMGAKNVKIKNNIFFDGRGSGVTIADRYDQARGTWNAEITGNIFYDVGLANGSKSSMILSQAEHMVVSGNTIINPKGHYSKVQFNYNNNKFDKNIIINQDKRLHLEGNHEAVVGISPVNTNIEYSTDEATEEGYTKDYTFTADKFTNNPRVMTLNNAIK